ncbi:hypothetical protein [Brucella anthropi]|uniref:hypothetical protein n=1 Tax=Brucella anthropi TaxID=529 RepID=UPI0012DA9FCE|nr:hypothetical protein [Brucella anthropi]
MVMEEAQLHGMSQLYPNLMPECWFRLDTEKFGTHPKGVKRFQAKMRINITEKFTNTREHQYAPGTRLI